MKLLGILCTVFALGLLYMTSKNGDEHAYRLTISVYTPGGVKSASGVTRVFINTRKGLLPGTGGGATVTGEAIFLDLGDGKNLAALLTSPYIVMQAFGGKNNTLRPSDIKTLSGTVTLRRDLVPTLMTFADLNNPASAKVIYDIRWRDTPPQGVAPIYIDEFSTVFGPGYGFHSATIEIVSAGIWPFNLIGLTGDPITRGIEQRLPWWGKPMPWEKQTGYGGYVDTRPAGQFRWLPGQLKQDGRVAM